MTTRSVHTKSYSPTSITAALVAPSSLSTNQHVLIGPATYCLDEKQHLYKLPEPWDPLLVLHALEDLPNIKSVSVDMDHMIFHSATSVRKLVHESFGYRLDEVKWKAFVAEQGQSRPELMAFDYTAEFHSRDVCNPDRYEGTFVKMGLFGQGNYVCGSLSDLSMHFAQDVMWNRELFAREPQRWRPDLYQWIRESRGLVFSIPDFEDGDE